MLENSLNAPEATAGENRRLQLTVRRLWRIEHGGGYVSAALSGTGRKPARGGDKSQRQHHPDDQMTWQAQ